MREGKTNVHAGSMEEEMGGRGGVEGAKKWPTPKLTQVVRKLEIQTAAKRNKIVGLRVVARNIRRKIRAGRRKMISDFTVKLMA